EEPEEPQREPPQPSGPALVRLAPTATAFHVGDTFQVQVVVDTAQNVGSIPFHLRYNRAVLQFMPPAVEGSFMNADGTSTVFLASDTADGQIVVGLSRMGAGTGASGAGILATFTFQAVGPGNAGFAFTGASVKDPQARNVPAAFNTISVEVSP
ncbi:MAG TPA: cohesin domain-containing protein, partial [Candidatus Polarisedimenticolaceae bacterium]|nr:cohesin domain-containing protein [Candidatus Polarisedimenticolaceae bacterium]